MFEFLSKSPSVTNSPAQASSAKGTDANGERTAARRAEQTASVKLIGSDEQAAAAFIVQCEFSELRLIAAEVIMSQALLEQVHQAIRNTDRRVARLLQGRIDVIRHQQAEQQRARVCIDQARHLLQDDKLTPNHVADLDRSWIVVAAPADLSATFGQLRAELACRLEAQVDLQRAVIDSVAVLRGLADTPLPAAQFGTRLEQLAAAHAAALAHPEHGSLPRQLLAEFARTFTQQSVLLATLEQDDASSAARADALARWSTLAPAALEAEQLSAHWQAFGALPEGEAGALLQQQFEAQLARVPAPAGAKAPRAPKPPRADDQQVQVKLDAMEASLQQGLLQRAADIDKGLKDNTALRPSVAQGERLVAARAELKRLSEWARWGGNVSREELVKAVEALPSQALSMSELAKKVGSSRERWKSLDALSGPAPKNLWERFDGACTNAYAPAAAHFKQLADERHGNGDKARALIAEAVAGAAGDEGQDWKKRAATVQRVRQAWKRLGTIERKEKKRLDTQFGQALGLLEAPLTLQRQDERARREQLIHDATALNATDRNALDTMRALQQRWQELARALPLERKAEQALWQRFRAACDAVFAKRKETANAADAERRAHQLAKEALCAQLEAAALAAPDAASATKLLRDVANQWHMIGAVPRANEAKLDKRHQAALAGLQAKVDGVRRAAGAAQANLLREKLRLCQALESALVAGTAGEDDWDARWSAVPDGDDQYQRALSKRFQAGLAARASPALYATLLENNRATLLREILRLEIAAGVDSGADFARERLKLQVEVLQSSLKSGQKPGSDGAQLLQLVGLPALTDARTATRIDTLMRKTGGAGRK